MNKISCNIIKDLLPLYYDDVCSEESKKMVEEHILLCDSCKTELDNIATDIKFNKNNVEGSYDDSKALKDFSKRWKNEKKKSFLKGLIIALLICVISFISYLGLFCWSIVPIQPKDLQVSEISQLSNGLIVYKYNLPTLNIKMSVDESGNKYITHYRSIMGDEKSNSSNSYSYWCADTNESDDNKEIKAIYVGEGKERILLWEKGMNLPKAKQEIEDIFNVNN